MDRKRRYRQRGRSRRRRGLLAPVVVILLMIAALANFPPPSSQAKNDSPSDTQGTQLAEDTALLIQSGTLPIPAQKEDNVTEDWKLVLVNRWNPLPEDHSIRTVTLRNGFQVDERCYPDLQALMDACRAEGLSPFICSAYRTWEYQERLYQTQVERWLAQGFSQDSAETEAGKAVAVPGTSEHQLGLAVDVVDMNDQNLDGSQENTPVQKWLMEHSWEYGFILRYPNEKSEITGIIYEPWHYRYVGRENAERIYKSGVCLEEYLDHSAASVGRDDIDSYIK